MLFAQVLLRLPMSEIQKFILSGVVLACFRCSPESHFLIFKIPSRSLNMDMTAKIIINFEYNDLLNCLQGTPLKQLNPLLK